MLEEIKRSLQALIIRKKCRRPPAQPDISPPPPALKNPTPPFLFPEAHSRVLPDPSRFFSPNLLSSPLPTNSFFQNFVLNNGDQPEYIHPYLIRSSPSGLSLCYPPRVSTPAVVYQIFHADLTVAARPDSRTTHAVSSFSDLGVTLDRPDSTLRFFLVRGSPFLTCAVGGTALSVATIHAILSLSSDVSLTKHEMKLNNAQTWRIYTSSPVNWARASVSEIVSGAFSGILRIAAVPGCDARQGAVLDMYSSCYPISGQAALTAPFCVEYRWEKRGPGALLMLASPLHLQLLSADVAVLDGLRYQSIDGELVGVVGDSWSLRSDPIPVTWHSIGGIRGAAFPEIVSALCRDVEALDSSTVATTSSYFYGKSIARAARLVLIGEEVSFPAVIPAATKFLKAAVEPWLEGSFAGNGFLYDGRWGGVVTRQGSVDSGADFGFGIYNDHHYHLGYFLYAVAVVAKVDPAWGEKYRAQAYSLMADFMTLDGREGSPPYPRLRCFDLWKLHSWAGGLAEFADGRNQESASEAVNAYYAAALMGLVYGDDRLAAAGSTLAALEILSARRWWHVKQGDGAYGEGFAAGNRVVGVVWANKRDSGLWFAPAEWRECRQGIQVLPLSPISEVLFGDGEFVKQLVGWAVPALRREGVGEGWKGFVYAMEGVYDRAAAAAKIRSLAGHDDGSSLTNLLWWIHSRGEDEGGEVSDHGGGKRSWSRIGIV